MTITNVKTVTVHCNHSGCKNTVTLEGKDASVLNLYYAMRKKGWMYRSSTEQLCPDHAERKTAAKKAKPARKAKAKKASKPTRKVPKLPGIPELE